MYFDLQFHFIREKKNETNRVAYLYFLYISFKKEDGKRKKILDLVTNACCSLHEKKRRRYKWKLKKHRHSTALLTVHNNSNEFFVVDIALWIFLIDQQLLDLVVGQFFAQRGQQMP